MHVVAGSQAASAAAARVVNQQARFLGLERKMRLEIIGSKSSVERLREMISTDGHETKDSPYVKDKSDLAFALGDVANFVTILAFALQLTDYIMAHARSLAANENATIRIKGAFGVVTIELNRDINSDELERLLRQLDAPRV